MADESIFSFNCRMKSKRAHKLSLTNWIDVTYYWRKMTSTLARLNSYCLLEKYLVWKAFTSWLTGSTVPACYKFLSSVGILVIMPIQDDRLGNACSGLSRRYIFLCLMQSFSHFLVTEICKCFEIQIMHSLRLQCLIHPGHLWIVCVVDSVHLAIVVFGEVTGDPNLPRKRVIIEFQLSLHLDLALQSLKFRVKKKTF